MATDRTVLVRLKGDASSLVRAAVAGKAAIKSLGDEIDTTNDRTAWLAQGILALAPAVTTLGAGVVPVISGLATQMTVGATAAGVLALGFNGVGDALGALNDYQLEPTAENMEKLNEAMQKIGPAGEEFVRFLDSVGPQFAALSNTAREGMFPGMTEGIESFMDLMPRLNRIVAEVAAGIGDLSASAGADLAGPEWREFFRYLETDARPILVEMGNTLGNFAQGLGSMMVAFGPLSSDFSSGLESMSESFAEWAANLSESEGFAEFVAYVQKAGPMALDFFGSLSTALVEIAEAAAPVGDLVLPLLTKLLDLISTLADTPLGSMTLGVLAFTSAWGRLRAISDLVGSGALAKVTTGFRQNLATANLLRPSLREVGNSMVFAAHSTDTLRSSMASQSKIAKESATRAMQARTQMQAFGRVAGPAAGQVGLLALAMTDADDKMGLSNTTALALAGSLAGPLGMGLGAAVGATLDLAAANDELEAATERANAAIRDGTRGELRAARDNLESELAALTGKMNVQGGGALGNVWNVAMMGWDKFTGASSEAQFALGQIDTRLRNTGDAADLFAGGLGMTSDGFNNAAASADDFRTSLERVNRALSGRASMRDYQAALDDFTASVAENGRTLNINTEAGRANEEALDRIASSALAVAENMKGPARGRFLADAREQFINAARAAGMGADAANRLADKLRLVGNTKAKPKVDAETREANRKLRETERLIDGLGGKRAVAKADLDNKPARDAYRQAEDWLFAWGRSDEDATADIDLDPARKGVQTARDLLDGWDRSRGSATVDADTGSALAKIWGVQEALNGIDRWVTVTINAVRTGAALGGALGRGADGMTVEGPRWPYGDKVAAYLAPGEEVISNRYGQADRHRDLLKAINANRLADGGTAGALLAARPQVQVTTPGMSMDGLVLRANVAGLGEVMFRVAEGVARNEIRDDRQFHRTMADR